jgi:hypothetical protein
MANTLAFCNMATITAIKSFILEALMITKNAVAGQKGKAFL